ncbi:hypothetical protein JCM10212_000048 [Sporobolomyces blumeae]
MGASTSLPSSSRSSRPRRVRSTLSIACISIILLTTLPSASAASDLSDARLAKDQVLPTSPSPPALPSSPPVERRASTATARPPIEISSALPSTSDLPASLAAAFDDLVASLADTTEDLATRAIRASRLSISGFPGTRIKSSFESGQVQSYLDCVAGEGEWEYDPQGANLAEQGRGLTVHKMDGKFASCDKRFYKGREPAHGSDGPWDVRESLKYRFRPSTECLDRLPRSFSARTPSTLSRTRFCQLLAHKSTLLLGSPVQYSLHDLFLDFTTTEPLSCYGDLYCKEHALCGGILKGLDDEGTDEDRRRIENGEVDERIYHHLPLPLGSRSPRDSPTPFDFAPHDRSSLYPSPTYSTLLRYRRTDGLRPATAQTHPAYQHPFSSILEVNQQWLADARRSDLVILEKAPIPLPVRTGFNETFERWFYDVVESDATASIEDKVERVFEAVKDVLERVWIPEMLEAVRAIRADPSPADQLVVYRGAWRSQAECTGGRGEAGGSNENEASGWDSPGDGPRPYATQPTLAGLLFDGARPSTTDKLGPLHIVYHNLQVVLSNHLVRNVIAPKFGIVFLDLESKLSVWKSGMVGGSSSAGGTGRAGGHGVKTGMRSSTSGDCHRYCFPSPGHSIEESFLGGLQAVMELGWAPRSSTTGDKEDEDDEGEVWVGSRFKNLRMRIDERERVA